MDAITLRESLDIAHIAILGGLTLLLLLFSAMASASEVAFFSLTHNDLADLEARNTASSRRVLDLLDNGDRLLATILVTNNMVNICLVIVATGRCPIYIFERLGVCLQYHRHHLPTLALWRDYA